ncbi:hypothetical protein NIES4071_61850 [Calothrix sp. NIES-4071]|nr:hypothetical protein NIES4071_61850 [Calothrix sp. NIES-4071]BAZ60489.1 hypothetical protein NIES4105_61800 [Calothrix sp. NIES-4105]
MHDTSPLYLIDQQLELLTLKELIEIRVKVDELIQKKNISSNGNHEIISHLSKQISPVFAAIYVQLLEEKEVKNDSIENVNKLVSEWMQDESDYDEETYPLLEEGLKNNRFSI